MDRTGTHDGPSAGDRTWQGLRFGRLRSVLACAAVAALASACDTSGVQRSFGMPSTERLERAEATQEYRIVRSARAFVNAPHALLVLERDLGSAIEQRITLPNATSLPGENKIRLRVQSGRSASTTRLSLTEIMARFGGVPAPFTNLSEGDLMVSEDRYGSYVYATRRISERMVCVLAVRRVEAGARPLPSGSTALDLMLRNCVDGSVQDALMPIGDRAFGLGAPSF